MKYKDKFTYIKDDFDDHQIEAIRSQIPYFENFLNRYSQPAGVECKLIDFALYCKKHYDKHILEVNMAEVELFFKKYVANLPGRNNKYISKSTAKLWRIFINKYFDVVSIYKKKIEGESIENPVPPKEIYDFDGLDKPLNILRNNRKAMNDEDVRIVLEQLYLNYIGATKRKQFIEYQIYIAVSLQAYSGARIRETLNITLDNLNLQDRWYITTVKSYKTNKREGPYFFPKFFVPELNHYLDALFSRYDREETEYLFHYPNNKFSRVSARLIQYRIDEIKKNHDLKFHKATHGFRDYINTKRSELGLDQNRREILLNQTPTGVNPKRYLKKYNDSIPLRDIYDKYNPYKELIKPSPSIDLL